VTQIRLGGLNSSDLMEMTLALGWVTHAEGRLTAGSAHSGNALYCRALLGEIGVGVLNGEEGGLPAPRDLSAVILAQVANLSGSTQALLAAAAVLGQHAPVSVIATVAPSPTHPMPSMKPLRRG